MGRIKCAVLAIALLSALVLTGCNGRHTDSTQRESQGDTGVNMDAVTTAIPDENANSE